MSGSQSPARWYAHMPHPAVTGRLTCATLRCFDGTDPAIEQPALDENVVAIHLGGAKRVHRWQGRHYQTWDVPANAITLMPAFRANRWRTEGVIAFAHLTLDGDFLARLAREEFDCEPAELVLLDRVGVVDPLMAELMLALGRKAAAPERRGLYRDSLLAALGITVLERYAALRPHGRPAAVGAPASGGLAGWQLRRVLECMAANVERDVGLDELVALTGLSRAQFFRAFRRSTGSTPARHMLGLRMHHAGTLLLAGRSIGEVAQGLGYASGSHFAAAFQRVNGASPSAWRLGRTVRPRDGS